jgi:hypothetical protein
MTRMNFGNKTLEQTSGQNPPTREESAGLNHVGPGHVAVRRQGPTSQEEAAKLIDQLTGGTKTNPAAP